MSKADHMMIPQAGAATGGRPHAPPCDAAFCDMAALPLWLINDLTKACLLPMVVSG